jgi:hypothetical protein
MRKGEYPKTMETMVYNATDNEASKKHFLPRKCPDNPKHEYGVPRE